MVQLPYLQPFEDVNKRVSRIGANIPLFKHNLCPLSFIDMPEHAYIEGTLGVYGLNQIELLRDVFVWAYERSCQRYLAIAQTMVEPDPLKIKYREALIQAVQTIVKGLRQPSPAVIAEVAQDHVTETGQAAFCALLTTRASPVLQAIAILGSLQSNGPRHRMFSCQSRFKPWPVVAGG